ncbi:MAG: tRNA lysidine(34) synthetase TilS [Nitrospirae bacterium CG_4_10_14_3_um_filter_44_29]|nr:MAG: tRNA lysidine(34) synthetase TilS [Nitrospirae bacterium CG1_02_44_142]PIV40299.1 MAG: tRNA lysidine(34) synthetase TilS [Nitrospirae bacterium CG02_land_8_20_14_3_00_44_33]PIV66366.1 MAG: tRNA lysidine(34) synthetase TilS [Nitrospirae bacterium CG01_land_8_20_14_3_00_44_22]PIW88959.1 MAG: tRNA lysidine(34) synthetase TilS [Nitrospirae bacterium CG_4_8_14_3_um_filter_44_28]PIX87808.1 MAG: tRNA lysidine(34) synthetase TilS [Nitrospirae bacterium CG_4_10_14_3_um_filter_44_29]
MNLLGQVNPPFVWRVKTAIKKHSMLSEKDSVLIGLSGGPDSVCLLHALNNLKDEYNLALHAIYIDHGLRPDEIPAEIEFCRKLCETLGVPFITKSIDVKSYAGEYGLNKQEAARELRYKVFEDVALEIGSNRIALAHNADDQTETFFMRILRGAGQKGLSGIPPVRGKIIRPLIEIERRYIEEFLDGISQSFIVDSSNLKKDYFRNWLRLAVMPDFKKQSPALVNTISRVCEIIREEDNYLELIVTKTLMKLISKKTDKLIEIFLVPLENMDKVILRRVLRRAIDAVKGLRGIGFVHIEDVIELVKKGDSGNRIYLPKGVRVIKGYATLILTSEEPSKLGTYSLNVPEELALKESGVLIKSSFADSAEISCDGKSKVIIDAERIKLPLVVRARKAGDFFYPAGFGKKKKLQDYFVDEKIPRDERDSIPIVLSGDDVIWISGYRADERFKVTGETKKILMLELKPLVGK